MIHLSTFKANKDLISKYGIGHAHLLWVMGLYLDYSNIDELASECLTDTSDDKKIDFIKLDFDNKKIVGHRVVVWVILYLLEHTGKDFQSEILLVT